MLRSLLQSVVKSWTRASKQASRRPARLSLRRPGIETLEDRLALSTASLAGGILDVNVSAGPATPFQLLREQVRPILFQADPTNRTQVEVLDFATVLGKFPIASIKTVRIDVTSHDAINIDNSNGEPFAPGTFLELSGPGSNNSLNLSGRLPVSGTETESLFGNFATLSQGGLFFDFSTTIGSVTDEVGDSGNFFIRTPGRNVTLTGSNGVTQQLTGLDNGGAGDTLTFSHKPFVHLEMLTANATVTLSSPAPAFGESTISVDLLANAQTAIINTTPKGTTNTIFNFINTLGQGDHVDLRANLGPVTVDGNASSTLTVGSNDLLFSQSVTRGIQADVFVNDVETFFLADGGNVTTREAMQVTESEIFGFGMFGSNTVTLHYTNTSPIIITGQLANAYSVDSSHAGAHFSKPIFIEDEFSNAGISVLAGSESGSGLDLVLFNKDAATGFLSVIDLNGTINPHTPTTPNGTDTITFAGGLTSKVSYEGFDFVNNQI